MNYNFRYAFSFHHTPFDTKPFKNIFNIESSILVSNILTKKKKKELENVSV